MEQQTEITDVEQQVVTLESEIKEFADGLPYWTKFLADKILTGNIISQDDIDSSYSYLLEELNLKNTTEKPTITINYNEANSGNYKLDLLFTKLEAVEGVNALAENQEIKFCPTLTIIYGANGSGKSGYVRLLKKCFYSKVPEDILQNIHKPKEHKPVSAKFTFVSENTEIPLTYPADAANPEFEQYAVFDNECVKYQLDHKNEFEFRPASLSFFSDFTEAIKRVEAKLNSEIASKLIPNEFAVWFDGESDIKTLVQSLSAQSSIEDLNKHTPFTKQDKQNKTNIERKFDDLALASRNKEKEIHKLEGIKKSLTDNKKTIEAINTYFTKAYLNNISTSITDCLEKEAIVKREGIENFKTDKIQNVGTIEWKNFIIAANEFAKQQKQVDAFYPESNDNCLLCHQPLSEDAQNLIKSYWTFIKSIVEQKATLAQKKLDEIKGGFERLFFDLFPDENTLTVWLTENHLQVLNTLKERLQLQKTLTTNILSDIVNKTANERVEIRVPVTEHDTIITAIDASIKALKEDEQSIELKNLIKEKNYLSHKEKFNTHFARFTQYIQNEQWVAKANKISWISLKRNITEREKYLSGKYFNQKYIDTFNQECLTLNGNFGIEVTYTGSAGTSFRQLTLKGRNPAAILSEGEQKVIALADFISEMQLSEVNRGVIFDDPVTSLDETRKSEIAKRLIKLSKAKQTIIFTHDLVFVSSLFRHCKDLAISNSCHWIENLEGTQPGTIWLNNTPSFEKSYKTSGKAQAYYDEARKLPPEQREDKIKNGFAALRTSYETLVVFGLFNGVVQRFEERVSVDSLDGVVFNMELKDKVMDSFNQCCRYMEGHSHSDKYAYKKPTLENLNEELQRFNTVKNEIKELGKEQKKPST